MQMHGAEACKSWTEIWNQVSKDELSGWVSSFLEAQDVRNSFQAASSLAFVGDTKTANFGCFKCEDLRNVAGRFIRFADHKDGIVSSDSIPFVAVGKYTLGCAFGRDKNKVARERKAEERDRELKGDHPRPMKIRNRLQPSKKKGCPAKIIMKEVILFPQFKSSKMSKSDRDQKSSEIRGALASGVPIEAEHRIYIKLPSQADHQNTHSQGPLEGALEIGIMDARGETSFRYPQFDVQLTDNFGYVGSVEAMKALKEFYELRKALRFHALRTSINFGQTDIKSQKKKYHWADGDHVSGESIPYDGIPYIILDKNVYECEYGADHKMWRKERRGTLDKTNEESKLEEGGEAKMTNHWKKRNCPAKIRMKEVMKFPDFQIEKDSRYKRNTAAEMLHDAMAKGEVRGERRIYIYLPSDTEHRGHTVRSQVCATRQHVDGRIINLIDQLVGENVTSVEEITQNITHLIQDVQAGKREPMLSQPSNADLSYHIQAAQIIHTYSGLYCTELEDHVARMMSKPEDQKFFFRKRSAKDKLLLVHQTLQQQRILERYALGGRCTLDSTCQTTLDALPLLLVSIQEGNQPQEIIGSAILQEKSHSLVKEALQVLCSWNPAFRPKSYTVEYDDAEIRALEDTFQGVSIHVCDYHRLAAWTKWASASMDCVQSRHTLLAVLESIANARTTEDYCRLLDQFRSSDLWTSNPALQTWFGSTWLPNYMMWAQAFSETVPDPKPKAPEACSQLMDDNDDMPDDDDSVAPNDDILTDSLRKQCNESLERLNKLVAEAGDSQSLTNLLKCLGRAEKTYLQKTSDGVPEDSDEMDNNEDEEASGVRNPKRQKLELALDPNEITVNKEALREAIKEVAVQLENVTGPVEVIFENEVVEHEEFTVSEDKM